MSLAAVELSLPTAEPPADVRQLLDDAQRRIQQLVDAQGDRPIVAFVPSDFALVYRALVAIDSAGLACGRRFAEWGSGLGVVTCLAAQLEMDAVGIEIENQLVESARELAAAHGVDAEFVCGSFLTAETDELAQTDAEIIWLRTDAAAAYDELGLEPDDFDLVFAYPWPGEEQVLFDLFDALANVGALLLTFHGQEGLRLQRKVSASSSLASAGWA